MNNEKALALFDFDETITSKDSFLEFLKFSLPLPFLLFGLLILSPVIFLYLIKVINNYTAKEIVISFFYKNWTREKFQKKAEAFTEKVLEKIIRESAVKRIQWHKENNHSVYVVSASIDFWMRPWCRQMGINLISTKLTLENDKFTGKFLTPNCYGPEKVKRIKEEMDIARFDRIYAYGDSRGDKEMLALADEPFYRYFS